MSNCLIWIMRLAYREAQSGTRDGKVTLISPAHLDRKRVFHLLPFTRQLRTTYLMDDGSWPYGAKHEVLAWHEIPGQACIRTWSVTELFDLCSRLPTLGSILRFSVLGRPGDLKKKIREALKEEQSAAQRSYRCRYRQIVSVSQALGYVATETTAARRFRPCPRLGVPGRAQIRGRMDQSGGSLGPWYLRSGLHAHIAGA
jgi:hypothetical protein